MQVKLWNEELADQEALLVYKEEVIYGLQKRLRESEMKVEAVNSQMANIQTPQKTQNQPVILPEVAVHHQPQILPQMKNKMSDRKEKKY